MSGAAKKLSKELAHIKAADVVNSQRYKDDDNSVQDLILHDLPEPPSFLDPVEQEAFKMLAQQAFWLKMPDTSFLSSTAQLHAKMQLGTISLSDRKELHSCLQKLGMTPTSRRNVSIRIDAEKGIVDEMLD